MPGARRQDPVFTAKSQGRLYAGFADFACLRSGSRTCISTAAWQRCPAHAGRGSHLAGGRSGADPGRRPAPCGSERAGPAGLARLAGHKATRPVWRAIGLDAEGLDLAAGGRAARAQFAAPATTRRPGGRVSRRCSAGPSLNTPTPLRPSANKREQTPVNAPKR